MVGLGGIVGVLLYADCDGGSTGPHDPIEGGQVGWIVANDGPPDHPLLVDFDRGPHVARRDRLRARHYAAFELEPVDDPS